jgi:hypothetical protein
MTEQEMRLLVRDALVRAGLTRNEPALTMAPLRDDASFALLKLPTGADNDGPCIIEPAVACNHCGYCKSYGH